MNNGVTCPLVLILASSLTFLLLSLAILYVEAATVEVKITESGFEPKTITIGNGDIVKWINEDSTLHTVTSGKPSSGSWGTLFDSSYLTTGKSWEHTFKKTGKFDYLDTMHESLTGQVIVKKGSVPIKGSGPVLRSAEKLPSITVDTTPNTNVNVSQWSNFTDSENRFSVQYPSHWTVTQSGNRFTKELPLVATDASDANATSNIQSQLSVNVFKSSSHFNPNALAKFAFNQFVKQVSGNKLVEPISCNKYTVDGLKACSFVYSGDDEEGKRYGILDVVMVDNDGSNHILSYRADPLSFDKEKATMDHIIGSYRLLKNQN